VLHACSSSSQLCIIQVSKLRKMKWVGYVACMAERMGAYRVLVGKPEGKRPLGNRMGAWSGFNWLITGTSGRLL